MVMAINVVLEFYFKLSIFSGIALLESFNKSVKLHSGIVRSRYWRGERETGDRAQYVTRYSRPHIYVPGTMSGSAISNQYNCILLRE